MGREGRTTAIGNIAVRLRSRYALMLLLVALDCLVPFVLAVVVPPPVVAAETELRPMHVAGIIAIPVGLALFIFALMDRVRLGRARALQPKSKKVTEGWRATRINLVLASVIPIVLAVGIALRVMPDDLRVQITRQVQQFIPGLDSHPAPADNR